MLGRALILAAVVFGFGSFGETPANAQNLEAGKAPSQIFSSTCSICHKSPRGLLKSVSPGSLPGFLRQHYTTSSDMASAMSAYVLSNGASNAAPGGNLTRQGQEARSGEGELKPAPAAEAGPDQNSKRGHRRSAREAAKPDAEGGREGAVAPGEAGAGVTEARQKGAKPKAASRSKPPKIGDRLEPSPKSEPAGAEAAKSEPSKPESPKPDAGKTGTPESSGTTASKSDAPKAEGTRPDPVPAVTPAPREADKPLGATLADTPKDEGLSRPLTVDTTPAPPPAAGSPAPTDKP